MIKRLKKAPIPSYDVISEPEDDIKETDFCHPRQTTTPTGLRSENAEIQQDSIPSTTLSFDITKPDNELITQPDEGAMDDKCEAISLKATDELKGTFLLSSYLFWNSAKYFVCMLPEQN